MEKIDVIYHTLQRKSQDILTAMNFISTSTNLRQKMRDYNWEKFLQEVKRVCSKHNIETPNLDGLHEVDLCRSCDRIWSTIITLTFSMKY